VLVGYLAGRTGVLGERVRAGSAATAAPVILWQTLVMAPIGLTIPDVTGKVTTSFTDVWLHPDGATTVAPCT